MPVSCLFISFFLLVVFLSLFFSSTTCAEDQRVAVIVSSKIRPYLDALEGFRAAFHGEVDEFDISSNAKLARHMLISGDYSLAVSIGPAATDMLWLIDKPDMHRLSCMVLDLNGHVHGKDGCGVDLRIPISRQLEIIKKSMPGRKNPGILYNPSENSGIVEKAMEDAETLDINLLPVPVTATDEILPIFSKAIAITPIDSLIFIPDSTVTSSRALIKHLVKTAFMNRIAVVGYNSFFTRIGAVISFVIDYQKSGYKTGEMASAIVEGKGKCTIMPPVFNVEWNENVWEKISIPEAEGLKSANSTEEAGERP